MLTQTLSYLSGQQLHVVVEEASSAALHWHNELGTGDLDEMDGASKSCGTRLATSGGEEPDRRNMAPPVQMVQSIRHDQLVSNMSVNRTFQSKWGPSEFLQSRRLLAGLSVLFTGVPACSACCFNKR
ncbi:uncharacterized protein LOC144006930 [Festucalex cinctus]